MKQYRVATISYKMGGLASSSNTKNKTLWFICSKKKLKCNAFHKTVFIIYLLFMQSWELINIPSF